MFSNPTLNLLIHIANDNVDWVVNTNIAPNSSQNLYYRHLKKIISDMMKDTLHIGRDHTSPTGLQNFYMNCLALHARQFTFKPFRLECIHKRSQKSFHVNNNSLKGFHVKKRCLTGFNVNKGSLKGFNVKKRSLTGFNVNKGSLQGFNVNNRTKCGDERKKKSKPVGLAYPRFKLYSVLFQKFNPLTQKPTYNFLNLQSKIK